MIWRALRFIYYMLFYSYYSIHSSKRLLLTVQMVWEGSIHFNKFVFQREARQRNTAITPYLPSDQERDGEDTRFVQGSFSYT